MTPMLVRPILEPDLPHLLALLQAKAEFDGMGSSLRATVESLRGALFADNPLARAVVAEEDGVIVGMATYYATFSSFIVKPGIWLDDLFVSPAKRGNGIGRSLVKHLCELAIANDCARIDWVVATTNEDGMRFYSRLGASISEAVRVARLDLEAITALASADA